MTNLVNWATYDGESVPAKRGRYGILAESRGQVNTCSAPVWLCALSEKNKHKQTSGKEIKV